MHPIGKGSRVKIFGTNSAHLDDKRAVVTNLPDDRRDCELEWEVALLNGSERTSEKVRVKRRHLLHNPTGNTPRGLTAPGQSKWREIPRYDLTAEADADNIAETDEERPVWIRNPLLQHRVNRARAKVKKTNRI